MRRLIRQVGPCTIKPRRDRFAMLVRSIISQQISGRAARSIQARLEEQLDGSGFTPERLAALSDEQYRAGGVSPQKKTYLRSLSEHALDGALGLERIGRYSDREVIARLTRVKGIGVWTVEMFLIFSLGRPDVLPCGDLGVRQAMRNLFELDDLPDEATCRRLAEPWRPYASIASWYCWRSLEL